MVALSNPKGAAPDGTVSVAVRALGVPVDMVVPASLSAVVKNLWHLCLDHATRMGPSMQVRAADPSETGLGVGSALQQLTQSVTRAAIEARAGTAVMLHAGGLCDPVTGAAVVYVAPGGTGKTTLTRALGAGRGYLSDETISIADDLTIDIYPKPLSLRRPGSYVKDETDPRTFGLRAPRVRPWLAGLMVLARDAPEGAPVTVEPVALLDAIAMLAPESSSLARLDRPLRRLADVVESVGGLTRVHYRDAADLEPLVARALERER